VVIPSLREEIVALETEIGTQGKQYFSELSRLNGILRQREDEIATMKERLISSESSMSVSQVMIIPLAHVHHWESPPESFEYFLGNMSRKWRILST
jgi:hypothetical protein